MASNATSVSILAMSSTAFASVNAPLSVISIIINIYFIFCMNVAGQRSERLKQPLNVLLGSLFGFNTVLHVFSFLWTLRDFVFFRFSASNIVFTYVVLNLVLFSVSSSVTSSLWLNVFYCSQIVPAQRSVFIWLKKNIKLFIYSALIMGKTYNLAGFIINMADSAVYYDSYLKYIAGANYTAMDLNKASVVLSYMVVMNFWIRLGINLINFCAMSAASCATVVYLWRHMKSMKESNSISSSHLQKQMRATITGIIQVLLYFFCTTWMTLDALLRIKLPIYFDMDRHILCTVISLYSFGTTINVCVGQKMFRQHVIHLWEKYFQPFFLLSNANVTFSAFYYSMCSRKE